MDATPGAYRDRRSLYWALWRVEMLATTASTATGFLWIFGTATLVAAVLVVAGVEIPRKPEGPFWLWISISWVASGFVIGLPLMMVARWLTFRRYGLACRGCGRRFGTALKEQPLLSTGRCPACGREMTDDAAKPAAV